MSQVGHKLPTELYDLIVQELDDDSLLQCSQTCRLLWQLSRPHIFDDLIVIHRNDTEANFRRVNLLRELMENEIYPIANLIWSFILVFKDPPYPDDQYYPPKDDPIMEVFDVLQDVCFDTIGVSIKSPIDWRFFPEPLQLSLLKLFHSHDTEEIRLYNLINLPFDILRNDNLQRLQLEDCHVTNNWRLGINRPLLKPLNLTQLTMDHNFPVLQIYCDQMDLVDGKKRSKLPYSELTEYCSKNRSQQLLWPELKILRRSAKSLETIKLCFMDNLDARLYPPSEEISPHFDLGVCSNLREFEFDYQRPYFNQVPSDLAVICDTYLKPSRPPPSLEKVTIHIADRDLADESGVVLTGWHALDEALTHEHFNSVQVKIVVVYFPKRRVSTDGAENLRVWINRALNRRFPALVAKDSSSVNYIQEDTAI